MALQNDWIVASLNNPHLDAYELSTLGDLDTLNTLFLSREDYLKSNYIRNNDNFKDDNGNFSESKFDDFYNQLAERFGQLQRDEFPKGLALDPFDTRRRPGSNIKKNQFDIGSAYDPANGKFGNPDKVKIGVEAWDVTSDRTKSEAEIAQTQKIFDTATGTYKDETPEDSALFENPFKFIKNFLNPFSDPLVLATYDKDEEDEYGIKHKKGEKKLNEDGTYYYETLNGRSPMGKQVLSLSDILTKEDSVLNHVDFMDSDDLEKSIPGVIAKNVAMIAPMFTPASGLYMRAMIGKEMVRAIPMMYEVATNLLGPGSHSTPDWMNKLAAKGESLTSGNSVYASEHAFSFENLANMITDIALQWGQLKQIAKSVNMLADKKALQDAEKRAFELYKNKSTGRLAGMAQITPETAAMGLMAGLTEDQLWKTTTLGLMCLQKTMKPILDAMAMKAQYGKDLALAYMAIVSNTDVYSDMLEKGATKKEAAWVTLGSTLGMFSVDKYTGIGEIFFDDERAALMSEARKALKSEINEATQAIYQGGTKVTPKGLFNKGLSLGKKLGDGLGEYFYRVKNHDLGMIGKAVGEGLEEVAEEAIADVSRGFYSLLGDLGLYDKSIKGSVIDYDTALERYGMSFLGGTLGGGLFYGVEKFLNRFNKREDRDLVKLIRDGRGNELREAMILLKRDGRVGSTTLSGLDYVKNEGSDLVTWLSTDEKARSQNDLIADRVIDKINSIEATIVGNNLNLTDDLLFENMVLSEARYQQFKNASHATGYYEEFNKRLNNLIAAEQALKEATTTTDGNPGTDTKATDVTLKDPAAKAIREQNIAKLQESVEKAKKNMDEFLSGDTALQYTRKLNFLLDPVLNLVFLGLDFDKWAKEKGYNEEVDLLKLIDIQQEWFEHVADTMKSDKVDKGFAAFEILEKSLLSPTMEQAETGKVYKQQLDALQALYELNEEENDFKLSLNEYFKSHKPYTFDSRLVDDEGNEEDEETYNNRHLRETADDLMKYAQRQLRVHDLNRKLLQDYVNQFEQILAPLNYKIDAAAGRQMMLTIRRRIKDEIGMEAQYGVIDSKTNSLFNVGNFADIISSLNDDLSNRDEVEQMLHQRLFEQLRESAERVTRKLERLKDLPGFAIDVTPHQIGSFIIPTGINVLKSAVENMTDDEIQEKLDDISGLNSDENYFIKDLLAKQGITSREEYVNAVTKIGSGIFEASGLIQQLVQSDLGAAKNALNNLLYLDKVKLFLTENPDPDLAKINEFGKELINDYNDLIKLILPQSALHTEKNISEIFTDFAKEFSDYRIEDIIYDLLDPDSDVSEWFMLFSNASEAISAVYNHLATLTPEETPFGKDTLFGVFGDEDLDAVFGASATVQRQKQSVTRYLDNTILRIKTNPVFLLYGKLLTEVNSPLEKILQTVATQISDSPVDVKAILDSAYLTYVRATSPSMFELEPELMKQLEVAEQALKMASAFIYAASTRADGTHYFGQNHQINEFAENHKDALVKLWNPLPEIDEEYATLLNEESSKLYKELLIWRMLSDSTTINKIGRLSEISALSHDLKYKALKGISLKFTVGDKEFDLKEGIETLPELLPENNADKLNELFEIEQTIHENFLKALEESKATPEEVFDSLFSLIIGLNSDDMMRQRVGNLDLTMKGKDMLPFDKALYLLTIVADNPSAYYKSVINSVTGNEKIAPLTVQQNLSRLAEAAHTKIYKEGFKQLAKKFNKDLTVTPNIVHIDGVAGAGKTEVVLKEVRQRYKDDEVICVGPTSSQAIKLAKSLNEVTSYTFDPQDKNNIFKVMLGASEYNKLNSELERAAKALKEERSKPEWETKAENNEPFEVVQDSDSFRLVYFNQNGHYGTRIELKTDKIEFTPDLDLKLIFVDEAAHMNPLQIALLNEYAERVGGTVYLASDSIQSGYNQFGLENLGPTSIFCTRTSKLKESLRSANIQMQENAKKLEEFLDGFEAIFNYGTEAQQNEILNRAGEILKKSNFRVYNGEDDINGWLFGAKIQEVIKTLMKVQLDRAASEDKISIGFIGDKDSPVYQALKSAGLNVSDPLSSEPRPGQAFMQGQEFDYVIIDHIDGIPEKIGSYNDVAGFVKKVNTLGTRGKTASIFLDGEPLTKLFGTQQVDTYKSPGFNISKSVDKAREDFLQSLSKLKLRLIEEPEEKKEEKKKEKKEGEESHVEAKVEGEEVTIDTDSLDDVLELDPETTAQLLIERSNEILEEIDAIADTPGKEEIDYNETVDVDETSGNGVIEANTVMPILSIEREMKEGDKYDTWIPFDISGKPKVRRNLQCFLTTDLEPDGISKLSDKEKYQRYLHSIQSYVLFGGKLPQVPGDLDWSKMKLQLSVRKKEPTDKFGIKTDLTSNFVKVNGETYVISIVANVPNNSRLGGDEFDAIFDIALLSDPNLLVSKERLDKIIKNINKSVAKLKEKLRLAGELKLNDSQIKAIKEQIKRAETFKAQLPTISQQYKENIETMIQEEPDGFELDLSVEDYRLNKTTRLVHRGSPRRLGTHINIANIENGVVYEEGKHKGETVTDTDNHMEADMRKVDSDVYILGSQSGTLKSAVDESCFGKAVIFTSNNTNLDKDELAEMYIKQKLNPDSHTPEVRMIVLDNHGLSFSELVHHRILKVLAGETGKHTGKPWRMDVLGIRMFSAMWNFRAGLHNFLEVYKEWKKANGYSDLKVMDILKAEVEFYNKVAGRVEDVPALLARGEKFTWKGTTGKITEVELKELTRFNYELCKDIPIFRLGLDLTKDRRKKHYGGYIRPFRINKDSEVYDDKAKKQGVINLLALQPDAVKKFSIILDTIFGLIVKTPKAWSGSIWGENAPKSMLTRITHPDGSNIKPSEYIGRSKKERNLSNMIHTVDKQIVIGEPDGNGEINESLKIAPEAIFSFFPKMITAIVTRSKIAQANPDKSGLISISTVKTVGKDEVTDKYNFDVAELVKQGLLESDPEDNTLYNLFDIIFHGTTLSLEEWRKPREGDLHRAYLYDAPFKYGFFVDPDLEYTDLEPIEINIGATGEGNKFTLLKCSTSPAYFDVNVDVIPGGIGLYWQEVMTKFRNRNKKKGDEGPSGEEVKYSDGIRDAELKVAFENYILDKGLGNTEEEFNNFMLNRRYKTLADINSESDIDAEDKLDLIDAINDLLPEQSEYSSIEITDIVKLGDEKVVTDTNGKQYNITWNADEGKLNLEIIGEGSTGGSSEQQSELPDDAQALIVKLQSVQGNDRFKYKDVVNKLISASTEDDIKNILSVEDEDGSSVGSNLLNHLYDLELFDEADTLLDYINKIGC